MLRYPEVMQASAVFAALADDGRLRMFGEIARDPGGVAAGDLPLDRKGRKMLSRLLEAGLVERDGERYVSRPRVFREALAAAEPPPAPLDGASDRVAALFSRGRLTAMPRAGELRTELLRYLVRRFDGDRAYSEQELRELLEPVHSDHAALRRYLVDEGLLNRDNLGTYWRPD
jgi:hypothetical protein